MHVLSWKGPAGLVGGLIRLKTGSPYVHTELLFSDGERFRINMDVSARFYWPSDAPNWDERLWDCIEITGGDEAKVRAWCINESGCIYDWRGIAFCQVFPWGWEHPDRWFCSELGCAALQAGGYPQVAGLKPYQQSPAKLAGVLLERGGRLRLPNDG